MELYELMKILRAYAKEGTAVQEQMDAVLRDEDLDEQNPNALKIIKDLLDRMVAAGVEEAEDYSDRIEEHLNGAPK